MDKLESLAGFFQKTAGNISLAGIDHVWMIVGAFVLLVALVAFSQDKTKAIAILLTIYAAWFVLGYIPAINKWLSGMLSERDLFYVKMAFGALPLAAIVILRKKRSRLSPRTR